MDAYIRNVGLVCRARDQFGGRMGNINEYAIFDTREEAQIAAEWCAAETAGDFYPGVFMSDRREFWIGVCIRRGN